MEKVKIICYGLGKGFEDFLLHLDSKYAEIIGVIDKNSRDDFEYPALKIEQLRTVIFDYIIICSRNYKDEIAQDLIQADVPLDKIIAAPSCVKLDCSYQNNVLMKQILRPSHVVGNLVWGQQLPFQNSDNSDYVRKATLALILEMLDKNSVQGSLAELGVCTGAFARLINERFPEKELYLFDTFEGFDERDLTAEKEFGVAEIPQSQPLEALCNLVKETSAEYVLAHMPHPENSNRFSCGYKLFICLS